VISPNPFPPRSRGIIQSQRKWHFFFQGSKRITNSRKNIRRGIANCEFRRSPNTLPLVGNGLLFLQARHKLFSWFVKCERQFGFETFQISIPTLPGGVVVNDPQNLEYILKHEGVFAKGDFFKRRSFDLFGKSRFTRILYSYS
jgi:hypothetical protein